MVTLLLALIYLAFISLGLPDSLLGSAWPVMHGVLEAPLSFMGIVTMLISGCTVLSSLFSEWMTKKFTTQGTTIFSVFLTAVALFGFSYTQNHWMLLVWAVPYGLGAGAIDAALNNYVALHYNARHMSWLHCFWGAGAIISPYVMSFALTNATWRAGYQIVGLMQLVIGIVLLVTLPLWRVHKKSGDTQADTPLLGVRGAFRIKGVPTILFGFFCYCAAEATVMAWSASYLVYVRQISEETAAAMASLFYIGITFGRFAGGFITDRVGDRRMIRLGFGIIVLGVLCLMLPTKSDLPSFAGFVIIGLGCAPIYPCIIHSTPYNFGEENSQAIIGIQMAFAYTGSTLAPPVYGWLGDFVSMKILPFFLIAFFIVMLALVEKTYHTCSQRIRN